MSMMIKTAGGGNSGGSCPHFDMQGISCIGLPSFDCRYIYCRQALYGYDFGNKKTFRFLLKRAYKSREIFIISFRCHILTEYDNKCLYYVLWSNTSLLSAMTVALSECELIWVIKKPDFHDDQTYTRVRVWPECRNRYE